MHIYVVSGPIHSGKTTRLSRWAASRPGVRGILAPIRDGHRHLAAVDGSWSRDLERIDRDDEVPGGRVVAIGPHRFSAAVFAQARMVLADAAAGRPEWLVIDEIGPLELRGEGLEPAVTDILRARLPARLVLVIRDTMVERVVAHYGIDPGTVKALELP